MPNKKDRRIAELETLVTSLRERITELEALVSSLRLMWQRGRMEKHIDQAVKATIEKLSPMEDWPSPPTVRKSVKPHRYKAQDFLWHFSPRWKFSHDHWWPKVFPKDASVVPREAALWEFLRRHPRAERIHSHAVEPSNLVESFIADHGFKSWPELTANEKREWLDALVELPPQRGFDLRPVYSVTAQALDWKHGANPAAAPSLDKKLRQRARKGDSEARRILTRAVVAQKHEIMRFAAEHHEAGRVLIAIDPDIAFDDAIEMLKACYQQHRKRPKHGAARIADWLLAFRKFEHDELTRSPKYHRSNALFVSYRRILSR